MSRPIIHCPGCGRELYHLHRPQCLWCGARIGDDQFAQVAVLGNEPLPVTPLPFISPAVGTPWIGRGWQTVAGNPFPLIRRSVSPWERKLRIAGAALFVCMMLAHFGETLWSLWFLHHALPLGHHTR